jgi:hypothetical protein
MLNLFTQIIEATDQRTVDRIVEKNLLEIPNNQRSFLCQIANKAKIRIYRVESEKKKSWSNQNN